MNIKDEETLVRAWLAHHQSMCRQLAALHMERMAHPRAGGELFPSLVPEISEMWEQIRREIVIVLGPEAELKPWGELAKPGTFHTQVLTGRDPFRITLGVFKQRCDKARRKHPDLKLFLNWEPEPQDRAKDDWDWRHDEESTKFARRIEKQKGGR